MTRVGCDLCGSRSESQHQCFVCYAKYATIEEVISHQKIRGHDGGGHCPTLYEDPDTSIVDNDGDEYFIDGEDEFTEECVNDDASIDKNRDVEDLTEPPASQVSSSSESQAPPVDAINNTIEVPDVDSAPPLPKKTAFTGTPRVVGEVCGPDHSTWRSFIWAGPVQARCIYCRGLIAAHDLLFKSTGNANKHLDSCTLFKNRAVRMQSPDLHQRCITDILTSVKVGKRTVDDRNQKIRSAIAILVAGRSLPLSVVDDPRFRACFQAACSSFVPFSSKTLRSQILMMGDTIQTTIARQIDAYNSNSMCLQIDLWTSRDVRKYVGIVLSVAASNLRVHHFNLPLLRVDSGSAVTGPVIAAAIKDYFDNMDVRADLPKGTLLSRVLFITTDGSGHGNNLSTACAALDKTHVSCAAHMIQSTMRDFAESDELFRRALSLARSIAGRLRKNTRIRSSVAKLVGYSPTRFDSMIACLRSVGANLEKLQAARASLSALCAADLELFAGIYLDARFQFRLNLLNRFFNISDYLSQEDGTPMAVHAIPTLASISLFIAATDTPSKNSYASILDDCAAVKDQLLRQTERRINSYYLIPSGPFAMAYLLGATDSSPRKADLYFGIDRAKAARRFLSDMLDNSSNALAVTCPNPLALRAPHQFVFDELPSHQQLEDRCPSERWFSRAELGGNLATFAYEAREQHPEAYNLAKKYFAVAPTEVAVERLFSRVGDLVSSRRTSMSDEVLNALLLVKLYGK